MQEVGKVQRTKASVFRKESHTSLNDSTVRTPSFDDLVYVHTLCLHKPNGLAYYLPKLYASSYAANLYSMLLC